MDLLKLKYFQTVAKEKNVTQAASKLHISQPALSMAISNVEEELGVRLFARKGRGIVLNEYGTIFLKSVDMILQEYDKSLTEIENKKKINTKILNLGVNGTQFPQRILMAFRVVYPDVRVNQILLKNDELADAFSVKNIDLLLSSEPVTEKGLEARILFSEKYLLVVPENHPFAKRESISLKEVADEPFVVMPEGYSSRKQVNEIFKAAGVTPNIVMEAMFDQLLNLVRLGFAISLLTESTFANLQNSFGGIHVLQVEERFCKRDIWLVNKKHEPMKKVPFDFCEFVIENIDDIKNNRFL